MSNIDLKSSMLLDMELVETSGAFGCYPWDVTPLQYLNFAHQDSQAVSPQAGINAIGHAKRAIHAHVDFLLHNCGRCLKKSSFPKKLELLNKLKIITPRILNKYNRLRNVIEHDYIQPNQEQIDEVIDVAELFVHATKCYTKPLPTSLYFINWTMREHCSISCDWGERELQIDVHSDPAIDGQRRSGSYLISAENDEDQWVDWISSIMKATQDATDPYVRCVDLDALDELEAAPP